MFCGGRWNDYNVTAGEQIIGYGAGNGCVGGVNGCNGEELTVSSWVPLWAGLLPVDHDGQQVVASLQNSGLIQAAGVLTTTVPSGQQWDSPNAWPPLVLLIIEGLHTLESTTADALAVRLASIDYLYTHLTQPHCY
jgi:neutral trehalase